MSMFIVLQLVIFNYILSDNLENVVVEGTRASNVPDRASSNNQHLLAACFVTVDTDVKV